MYVVILSGRILFRAASARRCRSWIQRHPHVYGALVAKVGTLGTVPIVNGGVDHG